MKSNQKTLLTVVIALVVLCGLCSLAAAAGGGLYYFSSKKTAAPGISNRAVQSSTESDTAEQSGPAAPTAAVSTPNAPLPKASSKGLGLSRQDMITFLAGKGVSDFGQPTTHNGDEEVMGHQNNLCVKGGCATVILLGPAEQIQVVSVAVEINSADPAQTESAVSFLKTVASHFIGADAPFTNQMLADISSAGADQKALDKKAKVNGFTCRLTYNPDDQIAAMAVSY